MLITGLNHNAATQALIESSRVPCVHLMDLPAADDTSTHCVGLRQDQAGLALTQHLLAQGRKRIAFAAAQLDPRAIQRLYGWRTALKQAGQYDPKLEHLNPASSSLALGGQMLTNILAQQPDVDAIFFCNDDLAQGALLAALRSQIPIPQRVAIAGFNDLTGSDQVLPPLTTVRTPRAAIGREGAEMLLRLMQGQQQSPAWLDLGFEVVVRGSS